MITRRNFLKTAAMSGGVGLLKPVTVNASWFRKSTGYFGVHPFVENHPEAVFIMKTDIDVKINAKANKKAGEDFVRSVIIPKEESGIPVTHKIAIKPNLTAHTVENERFSKEDTMGIATDPYFVEGTIEGMKKLGISGKQFYIREVNGARVFGPRGYYRMAKRTGADLRDLRGRVSTISDEKIAQWSRADVINENNLQWIEVPNGVIHRKIPYLWPVNAPDSWNLNIAKFKAHFMGLTLCCKNFQGAVANGYQHFCTRHQGIGNLPEEHVNPDVDKFVKESIKRHIADKLPRWDRPEINRKDPSWLRPDHYDVVCQDIWTHRTLDSLSVSPMGLCIIEGIYGRDGDGFTYGPNPSGSENKYDGAAWDFMTNIIVFGMDPIRVDLVGKWLGGHEPGNFGFFHIAMERGMLSVLNPMNVPVYLWDRGTAVKKKLDSFERTPLKTPYLQKNYGGQNEPIYHLCNEPFDYSAVREEKLSLPEKPGTSVLTRDYPPSPDRLVSIEYCLPGDGNVMLEILDEKGGIKEVLVNAVNERGYHMASWNIKRYRPGKYLYRFRFNDFSEMREIIVKK